MNIVFYNIMESGEGVVAGPYATLSMHTDRIWCAGDIVAVYSHTRKLWTNRANGKEYDSLRFES